MLKLIMRHIFIGVGLGSFMVVLSIIAQNLGLDRIILVSGNTPLETRYLVATLVFYTIFILGAIGYEIEKWSFRLKITVHFAAVMTAIAVTRFIFVGINLSVIWDLLVDLFYNSLIVLAVWSYYFIKDRRDVKRINEKLKSQQIG